VAPFLSHLAKPSQNHSQAGRVLHGFSMQDVQPIYKWIVDSVIAKSRTSFLQEGVDECALDRMSVGARCVHTQTSSSVHIFKDIKFMLCCLLDRLYLHREILLARFTPSVARPAHPGHDVRGHPMYSGSFWKN
jgi:hypothetical protein